MEFGKGKVIWVIAIIVLQLVLLSGCYKESHHEQDVASSSSVVQIIQQKRKQMEDYLTEHQNQMEAISDEIIAGLDGYAEIALQESEDGNYLLRAYYRDYSYTELNNAVLLQKITECVGDGKLFGRCAAENEQNFYFPATKLCDFSSTVWDENGESICTLHFVYSSSTLNDVQQVFDLEIINEKWTYYLEWHE